MKRGYTKSVKSVRSAHTNKKKCSGTILTMILVFFLVTFIVTIGEFYRIHLLQQDVEYQLQRSVNCAVEFSMGDSYRQDKIVNLDVALAKEEFYKYLTEDVGLDSSHRKYKDGKLEYKLYFTSVEGTSSPAVLTLKGNVEADSMFAFLSDKIKIPFSISSTNYRLD